MKEQTVLTQPCNVCHGTGTVDKELCSACNGAGQIPLYEDGPGRAAEDEEEDRGG